jgi:hypothetical protein
LVLLVWDLQGVLLSGKQRIEVVKRGEVPAEVPSSAVAATLVLSSTRPPRRPPGAASSRTMDGGWGVKHSGCRAAYLLHCRSKGRTLGSVQQVVTRFPLGALAA